MTFAIERVDYTEPRLASMVERFYPDRLRFTHTYWVVDEQTGDFMFQLSPLASRVFNSQEPRYGFLLNRGAGARLLVARCEMQFPEGGGADVMWLIERIDVWSGDPIGPDDWTSAISALEAVGAGFTMQGVRSVRVVKSIEEQS